MPNGGDGELTNKNLLIYGYGGIGKEVARIAKAFEMKVTGIRRFPKDCDFAYEVRTPNDFIELLPFADYLVMALPDSKEARDVIDKNILKKMTSQLLFLMMNFHLLNNQTLRDY